MPNQILWTPPVERQRNSALWQFAEATSDFHNAAPDDYAKLHAWSVLHQTEFCDSLWDFLNIIGDKGDVSVESSDDLRGARFFPSAKLNYAENVLRNADESLAIIAHREDGTRREISRRQLCDLVSRIVLALRAEGIEPGDRIAAIVTNDIEAIALYLASAAVGAIWASCSPDFGPAGASDRLNQIEPKLLIAVTNYAYSGKKTTLTETINKVAAAASVQRIILIDAPPIDANFVKPATTLENWINKYTPAEIQFHRAAFDTPMVVLFSSGTTGKPKCIVHGAGGLLLQHKKEHQLHCDIKPGDSFFYFTTCGWMMWNWQISGLASEAVLVTYDGNPTYPDKTRLFDLIDEEQIAIFGTSAKYIDACAKSKLTPQKSHDHSSLKTILSTGSPLLPHAFDYVYRDWKTDVHLASISGGTDICGCFVGGVPVWPVRRGHLQGALLGMDIDVFDDAGNSIDGSAGELVCKNAHLTVPVRFWNDADEVRFQAAYYARFDGMWTQSDFVEKFPDGGYIFHGRSDTTLNPSGVRIGTAEIYRQVEALNAIHQALVVGQNWDGDQRIVLFVQLVPGAVLNQNLKRAIVTSIRDGATRRHMPSKIVAVHDIPRTRSGKNSESSVTDLINGRTIDNLAALANPESLEFYRQWAAQNRQAT